MCEHKEIDDMLADLAARDMASPGWLRRFAGLKDEYLHHIREEEKEQFVAAQDHLQPADVRYMHRVLNRRKKEEKAAAKVEKTLKHKGDRKGVVVGNGESVRRALGGLRLLKKKTLE